MRIKNLILENVGPFDETQVLTFIKEGQSLKSPPVTLITGENGAGKSIIIDAIRYLLQGPFADSGSRRSIVRNDPFLAEMDVIVPKDKSIKEIKFRSTKESGTRFELHGEDNQLAHDLRGNIEKFQFDPVWFIDYWSSRSSNDTFKITGIENPRPINYRDNALDGAVQNINLTKWITFFDYLRDSKVVGERKLGKIVFKALEKAVSLSITGGHRLRVSRTTLEPIISVGDRDFTLEKLSAGNIFILQHIVSLIYKAYCVIVLSEKFMDDGPLNIFDVPGLLLIDEPENHLHPKWQKVLLKSINTAFPNVQIIATTHSPFIISSIENSNIYVCKATETGSLVDDETDNYTNKPIDEILTTDLFNTLPFNQKITNLIAEKKTAIESGDNQLAEEIEKKLIKINPQYFSFLNLHDTIGDLLKSQDESDH